VSGCRIGRVRMKSGADVTILRTPQRKAEHADTLVRQAADIADDPTLCAYVIVAVCTDGTYNMGARIPDNCPVPLSLWPSYVAEVIRRELVTVTEIDKTLEKRGLL